MNLRRNAQSLARDVLRVAPSIRPDAIYPEIEDLAVIGDRHTAAILTRDASVVWYCPGRFDAPSLLGGLLDPAVAGDWRVVLPGARPRQRRYLDRSAVLETTLSHPAGSLTVTDWMNMGQNDVPHGMLCRSFTAAPVDLRLALTPRPGYGARLPELRRGTPRHVVIDDRFHLQASHEAVIRGARIDVEVPKGERAWAVLSDQAAGSVIVDRNVLDRWLAVTRDRWQGLADRCRYDGPWAEQVHNAVRTLHLLVYEPTGAIAAAATTGLPEIVGAGRNYDYRYTWLRDSAFVVRGLLRFETDTETACRHLGVFAALRGAGYRAFLDPVWTVGGERVPQPTKLRLAGYKRSRPVLVGNPAAKQLQLGSLASLLLGMKEVYELVGPSVYWDMVEEAVEFLIGHWRQPGHGIWEERWRQPFTSGRVFAVCAIEGLAPFCADPARRGRWRAAARDIRAAIERSFHTPSGAYAAIRGKRGVDISAALFPVWGYCAADDPAVAVTIREIEQDCSPREGLYHRFLQKKRVQRRDGSFLTGTFWMAHYWTVRGDLERARRLIEIGLGHANDLGLFAEEVNDRTGGMLGNLPQALVYGSMLSAVADYDQAIRNRRGNTVAELAGAQALG